jgi:hypothetical protein
MSQDNPKWAKILIGYYGLLQTLHLMVLIRAGAILLLEGGSPFPILPPPGGWTQQTMHFLVGLGITDSVGILLGMIFAVQFLTKRRFNRRLGVISLTTFITGAIVFAIGTLVNGAWAAHPLAYGSMAILFLPVPFLYYWLLVSNLR